MGAIVLPTQGKAEMPSIVVVPDHPDAGRAGEFHFKERVAASLLGDPHFARN